MMLMLRTVKNYALDPEAGKARPEQLVLQDDPSFLPEFAFPPADLLADLDLSFNLDFPRSSESQSLTPFGSRQSSRSSHVAGFSLVLPSSSPDRPGQFRLEGDDGVPNVDDMLQLDEPDFTFGEDGNIIQFTPSQPAPATPAVAGAPTHSDAGASARVRREHEEGQQGGDQVLIGDQMDVDLPIYGDDLPDVEATSSAVAQQQEVMESSSSVAAPMRRKKRAAQALPQDRRMELRNAELLSWNSDYLSNMKEAARSKVQHRVLQQAKKNAEHYVWGAGLGGLGRDQFGARGPLGRFMGDSLFELFTGMSRNQKATPKRDRDSGIDEATQQEARRKRQRTTEPEEIGRAQDDDGFFMLGGEEDVELPREAASALDDEQLFSAMPWNISASKRGSSAIPLSARVTLMSEQGRQGSRAGSRMVSASPLLRRSTGHPGDFEALQSLDSDALGGDDFPFAAPTSDPAEEEGTMQPSVRVREALSAEGENFFSFVVDAITEKRDRVQDGVETITFEELLPPPKTGKMIACQGFLMLLSLGTKGMLDVQQPAAFGDITLGLSRQAKALQTVEVEGDGAADEAMEQEEGAGDGQSSVTEAGDGDALPEPDDSHFQEQMAAGHIAAGDDDDHDSLYDDL
ncbi:R8 protein [Ascochyta clinopodiicola]|nr:R8 protein [Ascochyta clinopodiicola]